jgi:hypothetical protein
MNKDNFKITRDEAETVIVADTQGVVVYTTNPSHWKALKRRAAKLGGKVEDVFTIGRREVAGTVLLPPDSFSLARFGLRATPRVKPKPSTNLTEL